MAISATFPNAPFVTAEADFNRPADTTAYASGDLVAQSTTAGSCSAMQFILPATKGGHFHIRRVRLRKSDASVTNASFRVHFYLGTAPAFSNGDNAAYTTDGVANYLGYIDVATALPFASDAAGWGGSLLNTEIVGDLDAGGSIYAAIEARGAYTPASGETFSLLLRLFFDKHGY